MLVRERRLLPLHGLRVGVVLLSGGVEMASDLAELALLAACFLRVALGLRLGLVPGRLLLLLALLELEHLVGVRQAELSQAGWLLWWLFALFDFLRGLFLG